MKKVVKVITGSENKEWIRCNGCKKLLYYDELIENNKVCPYCGYHFRLTAKERIDLLIDKGTFEELFANIKSYDSLNFVDKEPYKTKIEEIDKAHGYSSSVITGAGNINDIKVAIGILSFEYIGGSLGAAMGEKLKRLIYYAIENSLPLVIVSASGGARMQEGIYSLMQMAKVNAAISDYKKKGKLYISILTNPTYGGTTASFAMLGDIIISEPKAMIGFAGPRVIEQTTKKKLPPTFQTAEFLLEHGFVDMIVERARLKETLAKILEFLK
ncbi:acetyl-CoA carboxylase, carboxyltransferase subunit beta [Caldisericum exile]|nr:acetyl-CoA carboxylase, carboxyltransferase subunit beta [Caldisericum exile]